MAVTLNANTSTGFIATSDTSGVLQLQTGGTTAVSIGTDQSFNFSATGQRITGDFSNATVANRVMFQTSTTNSATDVGIAPNGSGAASTIAVYSSSDMNNSSRGSFNSVSGTDIRIASAITGTGTYLPMTFYTGGTERMRIDTSGNLLFNSGYGSAATAYGCRAWVNFNGTGTVAIRASGNVTSITDNGVGSYTVNFTTAMPDVNYCVSGAANLSVTGADAYPININAYSTSSCAIDHREAGTQTDTNYMNVAFFR
jgi:hypothetical protein